ncbi:MAG: DNA-processing protein DprA [Brevibacterium aurantiacum]|uniref:DNA-processing protein DprA n=1 Tax=Brevibacterium aurantiacum TaxID=273384 RepID=UPI003F9266D0
MDSVTDHTRADRASRAMLAAVFEPGDPVAGSLLRSEGAAGTLRIAREAGRVPGLGEGYDELWRARARAAPDDLGEQIVAESEELGMRILIPGDPGWLIGLDQLGDRAPYALWVRGKPGILGHDAPARMGIVGARAATPYGADTAADIAGDLAQQGMHIVSGSQYGIDAAAHRAALLAGGVTIAVVPSGLDRLHPAGNTSLLGHVAESGQLVSELPPDTEPSPHRTRQYSRIIAALSDGVLVPEASPNSSSFRILSEARALNRPIGAIPGPVTSPTSTGCNLLIQGDGAQLIIGSGDARTFLLSGEARLDRQLDLANETSALHRQTEVRNNGPDR